MADLWTYARNNDVVGLQNLFAKGIGIKASDENGMTLLHHAAASNSLDVLRFLIYKGAVLDSLDTLNQTVCKINFNSVYNLIINF